MTNETNPGTVHLVPRQPTDAMFEAAAQAWEGNLSTYWALVMWQAMIDAAPTAAQPPAPSPLEGEVRDRAVEAAFRAIAGDEVDPHMCPEAWEHAEAVALAILAALSTEAGSGEHPCRHEWYQGQCVHCEIPVKAYRAAIAEAGKPIQCEPMHPDAEGWSEWVHPIPGYLMQCCDCGLIHEMQFEIVKQEETWATPLNPGEHKGAIAIFRARRSEAGKPAPAEPVAVTSQSVGQEAAARLIEKAALRTRALSKIANPWVKVSANDILAALAEPASPPPVGEQGAVGWRCFHCGDTFTDERSARLHFGRDETSVAACVIKAGAEGSLLKALRDAEEQADDAIQRMHNESTDAALAFHQQRCRHNQALIAAEEAGYEKGLADGRALSTPATTTTERGAGMSWKRPDYSPREVKLLREAPYFGLDGTYWQTNETPPRSVTIKGRAGIDPDVQVVEIDGDPKPRWLMACGNTGFDGHIIGTDIWIREAA